LITSKNIIVPSELVFNDLQHKFFSKHATIIPNGIDISANTTAQDKEKINRNFIKLLYVGRLIKHKNTDFLLQIMSQSVNEARNWHLTIVGAGPMRSELVSSIKKLNLEEWVTIESNVSNINLKTHYRTSDVFVFPSEREGFGISVSEALSNNLPVIVYDVPENASISMISSDIFGCKISSLNPQSWVSAIIDILDRDSNKEAGPLVLGLPSWKSVSEQYRNYLEALQNNH
jgi:glycosyltransferase involved in cell wall biosynthesis